MQPTFETVQELFSFSFQTVSNFGKQYNKQSQARPVMLAGVTSVLIPL